MKEQATVVALGDGDAWVETRRRGTCGSCQSRTDCGGSLMERVMPGRPHYIRALIEPGQATVLAVGDSVEVLVPDGVVLRASVIVYLLPLGLFILGMFGGTMLVPGDPGAIAGGALGLLAGFAVVRVHAGLTRNSRQVQPRLVVDATAVHGNELMPGTGSCGPDAIRVVE